MRANIQAVYQSGGCFVCFMGYSEYIFINFKVKPNGPGVNAKKRRKRLTSNKFSLNVQQLHKVLSSPFTNNFSMQQPTCTNIRIRSTVDAHKIFSAVQQGLLHMVSRRLDADERQALRSGCIYAWEERGPHSETTGLGIERFTEGRRWSPSRVREVYLIFIDGDLIVDCYHIGVPLLL